MKALIFLKLEKCFWFAFTNYLFNHHPRIYLSSRPVNHPPVRQMSQNLGKTVLLSQIYFGLYAYELLVFAAFDFFAY